MLGDQLRRQRHLVITIEVRPVERDHEFLTIADDELHPRREELPDVDAIVAQQPVHLLHAVTGLLRGRLRVAAADGVDRQRCCAQHASHAVCQRDHALRVQVVFEDRRHCPPSLHGVSARCCHRSRFRHSTRTQPRPPKFPVPSIA